MNNIAIKSLPCRKRSAVYVVLALIFALFIGQNVFGQLEPFLLLEKPGTKHRIRYYVGDEVIFKHYDQESFNTAILVGFTDSSFYVNKNVEIKLREVEAMADRSKVKAVHSFSKGALLAIPTFFLFSVANNAFNTGRRPLVDKEVYTLAGAVAAIGGLGYLYKGKRYRLENRWRIIVVHH